MCWKCGVQTANNRAAGFPVIDVIKPTTCDALVKNIFSEFSHEYKYEQSFFVLIFCFEGNSALHSLAHQKDNIRTGLIHIKS